MTAVAPGILARGYGRIATVSSIRGHDTLASPDVTGYGAAKAALENITVSFAKELSVLIFLVSDAAGFITGQTLLVDGGLEAREI